MLIRIKNYTIKDVIDGINFLLERASTDMNVKVLANEISSTSQDKIASIYDWMRKNVSYIPDNVQAGKNAELFISPIKMVNDYNKGLPIGGDCDDHAIFSTALFRAINVKSNVILLDTIGEGFDHAISRAWSESIGWVMVDSSTNKVPIGWEESNHNKIII